LRIIMKLRKFRCKIICTLAFLIMASATYALGQNKIETIKININIEAATLAHIFSVISEKTEIKFSYGQFIIKNQKKHKAVYADKTIKVILKELGAKANFKFVIQGENVVITRNSNTKLGAVESTGNQQEIQVSGTVTDEDGVPIPGVDVM